jgi:hypothetical protein
MTEPDEQQELPEDEPISEDVPEDASEVGED